MEIKMKTSEWVSVDIAYSRDDGIFWIDAHCNICGSECVRAHKTGFGYILQCLDCKQEEMIEGVEVRDSDWRVEE